jgi:2,3-bisphosphoglycerate-dependent phosphoglycerate mutase
MTANGSSNHNVVATHGNLLTLILNYYDLQIGYDFWSRLAMPDVYHLEIRGGRQANYMQLRLPTEDCRSTGVI